MPAKSWKHASTVLTAATVAALVGLLALTSWNTDLGISETARRVEHNNGLPLTLPTPAFDQQIDHLLVLIQQEKLEQAAKTIKTFRPAWRSTAELASLACYVYHARGNLKKSKRACRTALIAPFKLKSCKWKHLAFNSVSAVFEKMGDTNAAINAARLAANNIGGAEGTFHMRLVHLLWRRGACADFAEVVVVLQAAIAFNNPDFKAVLQDTLRVAETTARQLCSLNNLPAHVQQMVHHPELMLSRGNVPPALPPAPTPRMAALAE